MNTPPLRPLTQKGSPSKSASHPKSCVLVVVGFVFVDAVAVRVLLTVVKKKSHGRRSQRSLFSAAFGMTSRTHVKDHAVNGAEDSDASVIAMKPKLV